MQKQVVCFLCTTLTPARLTDVTEEKQQDRASNQQFAACCSRLDKQLLTQNGTYRLVLLSIGFSFPDHVLNLVLRQTARGCNSDALLLAGCLHA